MTRLERFSLAAALAFSMGASASAQEPSPTPPPAAPAEVETRRPVPSPTPDPRPVLELSLQDTVARALEGNADIAVEKLNPEISAQTVRQLQGFYDPLLFSTLAKSSRVTPGNSVFAGGETLDTDTSTFDFGAAQELPTGGALRLDFNNGRTETNSTNPNFNPAFESSLLLQLQQPILRGFRIDNSRYQIQVAKRNRDITDVQFKQTVTNIQANVKARYYDLIYAIDNLAAQRKSLALAARLVEENNIKVRVGTMAPLDVVAAESEQASREEGVILAENALLEAEDALKQVIFPKNDPNTWNLRIVPTERPTAEAFTVNTEEAIARALAQRTDLAAARLALENAEYGVKFARIQKLPQLDLIASYGSGGIGGTQIIREDPTDPTSPPVNTIQGGLGDALGGVFGRDFPTWTIGVNFSYPLFNRTASAVAAKARLQRDQTLADLTRAELQVAADVRSAARAVETGFKRVDSTGAARVLSERRLDAEQKKFAAGLSTNFLVTQAQRDLALAEVAELRAVADYRKSLVNFERVQLAGGSGLAFASSVTATSTASSPGITTQTTGGAGSNGNQGNQ
jgi:outer membrane protein